MANRILSTNYLRLNIGFIIKNIKTIDVIDLGRIIKK